MKFEWRHNKLFQTYSYDLMFITITHKNNSIILSYPANHWLAGYDRIMLMIDYEVVIESALHN